MSSVIGSSVNLSCVAESDMKPTIRWTKNDKHSLVLDSSVIVERVVERVVFNQTHNHLTLNCLYPKAQSSYREFHSSETALLPIKNDILMNMYKQHLTLLVLLDLSAAFDTVDHVILLNRLNYFVSRAVYCPGSAPTYTTGRNQCLLMEKHPGRLTLSMVFLKGPVLALSSSFCMSVNYSLSSNAIYQKCTHMLTTRNSILPSNLSLNMRLMLSKLCKLALLIHGSGC